MPTIPDFFGERFGHWSELALMVLTSKHATQSFGQWDLDGVRELGNLRYFVTVIVTVGRSLLSTGRDN